MTAGDQAIELIHLSSLTQGCSFIGNLFGVPVIYSNLLHQGNIVNLQEASCAGLSFEDILRHKKTACKTLVEVDLHYSSEVLRGGCHSDIRLMADKIDSMQITGGTSINKQPFPLGNSIRSRLPPQSVGDLLQVHEFLNRFQEVLGLEKPLSYEELEKELLCPWPDSLDLPMSIMKNESDAFSKNTVRPDSCGPNVSSTMDSGVVSVHSSVPLETVKRNSTGQKMASVPYSRCMDYPLTRVHKSLLTELISELLDKIASAVNAMIDAAASKPKRGHKKDPDNYATAKKMNFEMLPINELTWPEMVRRYILTYLSMEGKLDSVDIAVRNRAKVIRCLQGDGGILCGSLTGVAGVDADALLLGRAVYKVFGNLKGQRNTLSVGVAGTEVKSLNTDGNIPDWAKVLDPVRKLPTNVGARIRNCVYEALRKDPPEWAKVVLEHSISKEVYKGNASGPTKRAVIGVLDKVSAQSGSMLPHPDVEKRRKRLALISDVVMKKCRIVLRCVAAADSNKVFCDLFGSKFINSNNNDGEVIFGSLASSRPLDLWTIDMRLLHDAYGGSHEAFLEEVRELWTNLCIAQKNKPSLIKLAEEMSRHFESLYEKEVASLCRILVQYTLTEEISLEVQKEVEELLSHPEIPKAPWETGICKVCGINADDENVLLCDAEGCNAEYHRYCLDPPLAEIPEGDWFCPSCGHNTRPADNETTIKKEAGYMLDIATALENGEYSELEAHKRTFLLKFLCDESLNTDRIRQNLDQSRPKLTEVKQKIKSFKSRSRRSRKAAVRTAESYGSFSDDDDNGVEEMHDVGDRQNISGPCSVDQLTEQLSKLCLRKDFLGRDSLGRLYWGFQEFGSRCGIIVNEKLGSEESETGPSNGSQNVLDYGTWRLYQSDEEINELLVYLKENDPKRRELRLSISKWYESRLPASQHTERVLMKSIKRSFSSDCLITKATALLESKYGSRTEPDVSESSKKPSRRSTGPKFRRCDCLEPIFPTRHHCLTCHETFFTFLEYKGHKGSNCALNTSRGKDAMTSESTQGATSKKADENDETGGPFNLEGLCRKFLSGDSNKELVNEIGLIGSDGNPSFVPESSLRPLTGEALAMIRQLKVNLLDMEAALPQGAKRTSKASSDWRSAWCGFIKSANTIYEMVEATVLLEDMIRTEYLKKTWCWYWSSLSAAAQISTISALALRIYTLDSAIDYQRALVSSASTKPRKRKEPAS